MRKTRKQRGGYPRLFQVALFSPEKPSDEVKTGIQTLLNELYGAGTTVEDGGGIITKDDFIELTGLKHVNPDRVVETTTFTVANPPAFLEKDSVHYDTRLTALEGQIADKLLEKGLDISLIPAPHGITDEGNYLFVVGLSHPASYEMRKGMYQRNINKALGKK